MTDIALKKSSMLQLCGINYKWLKQPSKFYGFQCVDLIHNNISDLENLHTQEQITLEPACGKFSDNNISVKTPDNIAPCHSKNKEGKGAFEKTFIRFLHIKYALNDFCKEDF